MKVDDGCVCILKIDDDLNDLLKQGDAQATKLEHSKDVDTYLKAAAFVKKKCNECTMMIIIWMVLIIAIVEIFIV